MGQGEPFYPGQDGSSTKTATEQWNELTKNMPRTSAADSDDDSSWDDDSSDEDDD